MKKLIQTGSWDNQPIYREETPEETLIRELGQKAVVSANIYKTLNENQNDK